MAVPLPDLLPSYVVQVDTALSTAAERRRTLRNNLELYLPLAGLLLMAFACFIWPLVYPLAGPNAGTLAQSNLPPLSPGHILGTNSLGNDILSRILYGGRVSFEVGFGAQGLGVVVGGALGMTAGFKGGAVESLIMRVTDLLLAFPGLIIAITIADYLGPSEIHVIWALAFFTIPGMARLTRAQTLRLREQEFIASARLSGVRDRWILVRHMVPNVLPSLLTFICIGIGVAILVEATLSFLGFGVPLPQPSWGNMIASGQLYVTTTPELVLIPAAFLFYTVMCLNLLADAIRSRISNI